MRSVNATKFHRKSGGAKPRDLQFRGPLLEMFSTERTRISCHAAQDTTTYATFISAETNRGNLSVTIKVSLL
jgi:hypothetical protein